MKCSKIFLIINTNWSRTSLGKTFSDWRQSLGNSNNMKMIAIIKHLCIFHIKIMIMSKLHMM